MISLTIFDTNFGLMSYSKYLQYKYMDIYSPYKIGLTKINNIIWTKEFLTRLIPPFIITCVFSV